MSDVEIYWNAIRAKWSVPTKTLSELTPSQQTMLISSINMLLLLLEQAEK